VTQYQKDLIERVIATAVEAGISAVPVALWGIPTWTIIPITALLAAIKGLCAKYTGDDDSASLASDV
jgi:hypothetical protein